VNKALLVAECRKRDLRIIVSGGAGGRKEGALARVADLAQASHDPLLQKLRKKLRAEFGFSSDPKMPFGIQAVYSPEIPTPPESCEAGLRMDCNSGYGAVTFVTGMFGFLAAGCAVNAIASSNS
jgi:tRNA A37 threonylcarbamoyladenosine dehydratase